MCRSLIHRQKDFAIDPIAVLPDEVARGLGQAGELLGRIGAVEALDEAPDLGALADELAGKDAEAVQGAFVEVGFDEEHGRWLGN